MPWPTKNRNEIKDDTIPLELPHLDLPTIDKVRKSNDDFMTDLIQVTNDIRKAIILVSGVIPQKNIELEKLDVLRGHLVRLYKLYDSYIFLIVERRTEIAFIILRALTETIINLHYLLKHIDTYVHRKYKRASLAYENRLEENILKNILKRKEKLPIEERMLKSIASTFSRSGFDNLEKEELKKTQWGLEKQHLEISGKAGDVGLYPIYENMFMTSSHFVHGSWHELDFHHLERERDSRGTRAPQIRYTNPKPQLLEAVSIFTLEALQKYLLVITENSGQAEEVKKYLDTIAKWFFDMSYRHEEYLSNKQ